MAGIVRFILIGCLLQGALSSQWAVWLPKSIEALSGSCVLIPCRFEIPVKYENDLHSAKAVWIRGKKWQDGTHVFDSNQTQSKNRIQGRLIGDLLQKNCTIIMDNFTKSDADHYSFRVDSMGPLKFTFNQTVPILVTETPPKPKLTPVKVEVTEGTSVRLTCSAAAPCPTLPPTLTWTPRLRNSVDQLQENEDKTKSSVLTFTASHLLHGQKISCTALYKLQQGDREKKSEQSLTVNVLYPPKSTSASVSPSGSVMLGSSVTLTCSSNANPPVQSYTWYKENGREMKIVGSGQNLTFNVTEPSDGGQYYCEAQNDHGRQTSPVFVNTQTAGSHCSLIPYIICGILAFLYLLTVGVGVFKYRRLSREAEQGKQGGGGDTYTSLQFSNVSSDYHILQRRAGSKQVADQGRTDYENIREKMHQNNMHRTGANAS
ncbi:hypothetical protein MATL_G00124770 [Megalops atlanticus]|uniref:Ig-like domain-containing protein n=1 Tax=Megalops atlanticus TaxID=7932 RepID=A0A9D3TBB9_MEGAT|nr:hypothetical protein MATL_G00124770 [Megalops atlanticus]